MSRATLRGGIATGGAWVRPIVRLWGRIKPKTEDRFTWLFPHVSSSWEVSLKRQATHGVAQAALSRIEERFGFPKGCKLHSPRNWFATCAGQLLYPREQRERLGRWAPGSVMPDHYDKAVCATELRLRSEIIGKITGGWRPSAAFEVPNSEGGTPKNLRKGRKRRR